MLTIITDQRGSGKTSAIIREANRTGAVIVCASARQEIALRDLVKQLKMPMPNTINVTTYQRLSNEYRSEHKFIIDDLETILKNMNVETVVLSDKDCSYYTVDYFNTCMHVKEEEETIKKISNALKSKYRQRFVLGVDGKYYSDNNYDELARVAYEAMNE